mmetsp:Transcript_14583/g.21743  ORF Transcript_14583/g.21743 Transcript_14583/m.21743 type:complete len:530 (-) Transcript_14583:1333-2922(-)|eukprot:CAMPEP_0170076788 /NCGR_PEP_ID=MMETSP0019_2-20121128/13726_1 /TAXON_ID=98059 /ORGANISM="Dinobryon sp., Strain UTEXLB2267" /LENGTH=529 /DNA_ID=CAMNT_0010288709 /DNA_START=10 /DNA_END=1599 /DNA_ORIENTATION=-
MFRLGFVKIGRKNAIAFSKFEPIGKIILLSSVSTVAPTVNEVWKYVFNGGEYSEVVKLADKTLELTDGHSPNYIDAVLAAMAAYACGRNSAVVRKLFKRLPSEKSSLSSHATRALEIILHAYCVADNIVFAEKLLFNWINSRIAVSSQPQSVLNLLSDLKSRHSEKHNENDEEFDSKIKFALECNVSDIPLRTWASIARFYSNRQAWVQCSLIVQIVEELYFNPNNIESKSEISEFIAYNESSVSQVFESDSDSQFLWQLLDGKCFIAQEDIPPTTTSSSSSHSSYSLSKLPSLEMSMTPRKRKEALFSVYHSAVVALCDCDRFQEALSMIHRMKSLWNDPTSNSSAAQPLVAVVPSLLKVFTSYSSSGQWGFTSPESNVTDVNQLAYLSQALQPLHEEVVRTVAQLSRHPPHSGEGRAALALLQQYTHTLCELNLLDTAEETLQQLQALPHRPRIVSDGVVLLPVVRALCGRGDWRRARQLFEAGMDGEGVEGDRQRAYHCVCDAMRRAGEIPELTEFTVAHSPQTAD